jgi:hypothetical protein
MRTILAGSRTITTLRFVKIAMARAALTEGILPTVVLSGCAPGVDTLGERWAEAMGIPVERFPAPWRLAGRAAGPLRNAAMVQRADALVLVWDGSSHGSADMLRRAKTAGLRHYELIVDDAIHYHEP